MESGALTAIQIVSNLPAARQGDNMLLVLRYAIIMLHMCSVAMQEAALKGEAVQPMPYVEGALQVVEHLLQHADTSTAAVSTEEQPSTAAQASHDQERALQLWHWSLSLVHDIMSDTCPCKELYSSYWTSAFLRRVISTCEGAVRHLAAQPVLRYSWVETQPTLCHLANQPALLWYTAQATFI
mmetsp:Transcript_19646/g.42653  ORF Transcript_19646/g.42653 Transcript_19646/m.42653 type:complete len:183 (+) Transcript_19646:1075-1623(+)